MSFRLFFLLVLAAAVIASAIGVVHAKHAHRQAYIDLSRAERERDELNIEFGRLQLELATWSETNRIEQVASERLGMRFPDPAATRVIQP